MNFSAGFIAIMCRVVRLFTFFMKTNVQLDISGFASWTFKFDLSVLGDMGSRGMRLDQSGLTLFAVKKDTELRDVYLIMPMAVPEPIQWTSLQLPECPCLAQFPDHRVDIRKLISQTAAL